MQLVYYYKSTCFTSTKVQILTQETLQAVLQLVYYYKITCFTSTKVQLLIQEALQAVLQPERVEEPSWVFVRNAKVCRPTTRTQAAHLY